MSLACQGIADVRRAEKLQGPVSLYLLQIGESGERKSATDNFFTSAIIDYEKDASLSAQKEISDAQAKIDSYAAQRDGLKSAIRDAKKNGEATDEPEERLKALGIPPKPGRKPQLLYSEATPEALAWGLSNPAGWPSGAIISPEAGVVLGGHGMGGDSIMRYLAVLNGLWEGARFNVNRRTSESFRVGGVRLTMSLGVQPEVLRQYLERTRGLVRGSGFVSRFLLSAPQSTQGTRRFKEAPKGWPHLAGFHSRIRALLDAPIQMNEDGELSLTVLELSPEAKAAWIKFHDDVEGELADQGDLTTIRDIASKAADNVARLSALFHLYAYGPKGVISAEHVNAAGRIVSWHLFEARRFLGEVHRPKTLSDAVKLDKFLIRYFIKEKTTSCPTRTAMQFANLDKKSLEEALSDLHAAGRAELAQDGRKRFIQINPRLVNHGT
jgi:putative DNA primase/helicase